jgi:hypothetical protein
LTPLAASGTVTSVMNLMARVDRLYAYSFTPPVLPAGKVALT